MSPADRRWAAWTVGTLATFGYLERAAFASHDPASTLTWTLRRWLGIEPARPWRPIGVGGLVGFLGWCAVHILLNRFGIRVRRL